MKVAVVNGETDSTIYLYEEHEGWVFSAQLAMHLPGRGPEGASSEGALRCLRDFLARASALLNEPDRVFSEEKTGCPDITSDETFHQSRLPAVSPSMTATGCTSITEE